MVQPNVNPDTRNTATECIMLPSALIATTYRCRWHNVHHGMCRVTGLTEDAGDVAKNIGIAGLPWQRIDNYLIGRVSLLMFHGINKWWHSIDAVARMG